MNAELKVGDRVRLTRTTCKWDSIACVHRQYEQGSLGTIIAKGRDEAKSLVRVRFDDRPREMWFDFANDVLELVP